MEEGVRLRGKADNPAGERWLGLPRKVRGAPDTPSPPVEHMGVYHRCADVLVPEKFLDRPDIIPILQEVGSERMPEGVAGDGLRDPGPLARVFDGPLDGGVVKVVPEEATGGRFPKLALCGEYPLPSPLAVRGLVLPLERSRKGNVTAPSFQIPFMLLLPLL